MKFYLIVKDNKLLCHSLEPTTFVQDISKYTYIMWYLNYFVEEDPKCTSKFHILSFNVKFVDVLTYPLLARIMRTFPVYLLFQFKV